MIAVDVGNTKTAIGLFQDHELLARWQVATDPLMTGDQYLRTLTDFLGSKNLETRSSGPLILASVVPSATEEWLQLQSELEAHVVTHESPISYEIGIPEPRSLGADRIAALEGAVRRFGAPVIVVDAGTATTVSVVDARKRFLGGTIAPGVGISLDALFDRAARLSRTTLHAPKRVVGSTTEEALDSGVQFGFAGMIEGLLRRIFEELGASSLKVIASGGAMEMIMPYVRIPMEYRKNLTLEGLSWIHSNLTRREAR